MKRVHGRAQLEALRIHFQWLKTLEILSEARAKISVYCRQSPTLDVSHHRYQTAGKRKKIEFQV